MGEEEKNKKLKRIYGRKRTNHKEFASEDTLARKSIIRMDQGNEDMPLVFKNSNEEPGHNELNRLENNFNETPKPPSSKNPRHER